MALKRNSDNLPENRVVVCSAETENPSAATAMPAIINSSTTNRIIILLEDMSMGPGLERSDHNVPMVLQIDIAFGYYSIRSGFIPLAAILSFFPISGIYLILQYFRSVKPMLDMVSIGNKF